jgi:dihydroneopterin aldolase
LSDAVTLSLDLSCIVGLLARERTVPQPLHVTVTLEVGLERAGETGQLGHSVDYGALDGQIRFLATEGHFVLLESLALAIARFVLLPPAPGERRGEVDAVEVRIDKPGILPDALPGVRLRRTRWDDEVIVDLPEVHVARRALADGEHTDAVAWGIVGVTGLHHGVTGPAVVLEVRQRPAGSTVTLPGR